MPSVSEVDAKPRERALLVRCAALLVVFAGASESVCAQAPGDSPLGTAPTLRGESDSQDQPPAELSTKYRLRDASIDGWSSEVFNETSSAQLARIGKWLAQPDGLAEAALDSVFAADFECASLRPSATQIADSSAGLVIARNDQPLQEPLQGPLQEPLHEPLHRGPDGAAAALAELRERFATDDRIEVKFKTISIEERENDAVTRCYVFSKSLFSDSIDARPARSSRATWQCEWSVASEPGEQPRLTRIQVLQYEESSAEAVLFEEATSAVFDGEESFESQLAPSLEHWAGRIERGLGMTLIGHEGIALGDVDGDGLDDLYVCQPGGLPNRLYLRQPDGTLSDVSEAAGVDFLDASRGALFLDLDNDGDQDLVFDADPLLVVLENIGEVRFRERARLEVASTTSIAAADYDRDGDLDLYCCGYILPDHSDTSPVPYHDANNGRPNTLLRNDIDAPNWAFSDVTAAVGLDHNNRRFSIAASWEDFDQDGDADLYVANDFGRNNLYVNTDGRFRDMAFEAGVEDMAAGMGVTWGDYDRDGHLDLYVSNMFSSAGERVTYQRRFLEGVEDETLAGFRRHARGNSLFRNLGNGTFEDTSEHAGVTMGRWAWGAVFSDLDNDGWRDLFVPNGFVTGEDPEDL